MADYKLVDEKTWPQFCEKIRENKASYNVVRDDLSFTVLQRGLIYHDNRHSFHSGVCFREVIRDIKIETLASTPFSPDFYVKQTRDGYELSITTPESYEKASFPSDKLIRITTIPHALFDMPEDAGKRKRAQITASLRNYGWELETDFVLDLSAGERFRLRHKYFRVYCKDIY